MSGTSVDGNDVIAFFDVGIVNHKVLNGTALVNGRTYYATVIGKDKKVIRSILTF